MSFLAWGAGDRIFLTKAQMFQAHAEGALDRDVQSVLNVRKRMHYGDFIWNDTQVPQGPVWVRVDLQAAADFRLSRGPRDWHRGGPLRR